MSYKIEELEAKDLGHVYNLKVEAGLGNNQSKKDWVKTQHWLLEESKKNTGITAPLGHIMYEAGRLVGFVSYSQRLFKSDGEISPAIVLNELVVHPDHRGIAGIVLCKHTMRHFEDNSENWKILGLHHSRDAAALWEALGSKAVPNTGLTFSTVVSGANYLSLRLPRLRTVFQILQMLKCTPLVNAMLTQVGKPVITIGALTMQHCPAHDILRPINEEYSRLLKSFLSTYNTGVVRDVTYLKWRYNDHPLQLFHWYELRDGNRLRAIAIAHHAKDGTATLCDLIIEPKEIVGSFEEILRAALHACGDGRHPIVRSKILISGGIRAFRSMPTTEEQKEYNQFWISPSPISVQNALYSFGDNKLF